MCGLVLLTWVCLTRALVVVGGGGGVSTALGCRRGRSWAIVGDVGDSRGGVDSGCRLSLSAVVDGLVVVVGGGRWVVAADGWWWKESR